MVEVLQLETPTHGRVLIKRPGLISEKESRSDFLQATVAGFHGYAQSAEDMMDVLAAIPGSAGLSLISVQALHRFYTRGDQKIVASWMTRQDREQAISDNVEYANRALDRAAGRIFVVGFSQGAAMAYRAGLLTRHKVDGIIAIGGDVPPDVKHVPAERWPRVLIAAGAKDHWYTADKVSTDETFLKSHGVSNEVLRYDAGHEITPEVLGAVSHFLSL